MNQTTCRQCGEIVTDGGSDEFADEHQGCRPVCIVRGCADRATDAAAQLCDADAARAERARRREMV